MRIGLDIDNVITDFDKVLLKELLLADKNLRNTGRSKKQTFLHDQFDWTKDEIETFYHVNIQRMAQEMKPKKDCKKYMDKLLQEGHELFLITNRVYPSYRNPLKVTVDWLSKYGINYTELVMSRTPDKTRECLEKKIDIMIDDRVDQCENMLANGINCYAMKTKYNYFDKTDVKFVDDWKDLYNLINKLIEKQDDLAQEQ